MFAHKLPRSINRSQPAFLVPKIVLGTHTADCPVTKRKGGATGGPSKVVLKRALNSGKVRMTFIPEEWFTFFHSKTGVTGPYLFGLTVANYCISKEIYIMEHEYYLGLSFLIVIALVNTKLGDGFAAGLDRDVDDLVNDLEKDRKKDIAAAENTIKQAKDAQWRAEGQKLLMDAKKENIAMQLEAIYRERMMHVYKTTKGRMDYHLKRYQTENRIKQKWMLKWILQEVHKAITPEFERQALEVAIRDLAAAANKAK